LPPSRASHRSAASSGNIDRHTLSCSNGLVPCAARGSHLQASGRLQLDAGLALSSRSAILNQSPKDPGNESTEPGADPAVGDGHGLPAAALVVPRVHLDPTGLEAIRPPKDTIGDGELGPNRLRPV